MTCACRMTRYGICCRLNGWIATYLGNKPAWLKALAPHCIAHLQQACREKQP